MHQWNQKVPELNKNGWTKIASYMHFDFEGPNILSLIQIFKRYILIESRIRFCFDNGLQLYDGQTQDHRITRRLIAQAVFACETCLYTDQETYWTRLAAAKSCFKRKQKHTKNLCTQERPHITHSSSIECSTTAAGSFKSSTTWLKKGKCSHDVEQYLFIEMMNLP